MLSIADRYVFKEWLKIFCLVLGTMFGLQFIVEVQDSFTDLLGYNAEVEDIFFYYAVLAPSFLPISMPASILVSILYALGVLHRNNEFIAFRSSGMSVFRITRSVWFAGLALFGAVGYALVPQCKPHSLVEGTIAPVLGALGVCVYRGGRRRRECWDYRNDPNF